MSQDQLSIRSLLSAEAPLHDEYPHLVRSGQRTYVVDGHHRVVRALILRRWMYARVLTVAEEAA